MERARILELLHPEVESHSPLWAEVRLVEVLTAGTAWFSLGPVFVPSEVTEG